MLRGRTLLAAGAICAALSACGQPERQQSQDEPSAMVASSSHQMNIGPDGAAGISNALPMNLEAVRAAAPSYAVAQIQDQVEGAAFTAITLSAGDEEVFRVLPTADGAHIHAIVTKSPQARGPTEDIVGRTLFGVAPPDEVPFCVAELVSGAAGFACSTDASGTFWRVYQLPEGYDGPSDPFDAIDPDVLHDATLAEMRWIAPR